MSKFKSWHGIDATEAEKSIRRLNSQVSDAEELLRIQTKLCEEDSESFAYRIELKAIEERIEILQVERAEILKLREYETVKFALTGDLFENHTADLGNLS